MATRAPLAGFLLVALLHIAAPLLGAAEAGPPWIPKPGPPASPVLPPDTWATSKFRDFYTTRSNWDDSGVMGFVVRYPALPNVLLVGDSISIGYTLDVRRLLQGKANVYRISGNGGDCTRFLGNHPKYLGDGLSWDLIHFNWGLHDLVRQDPATKTYDSTHAPRYTDEEYVANLEKCVGLLRSTGAHLVWASTTPIPANAAGRITGDEVRRNALAAAVMETHDIAVNDLYTLMKSGDDLHAAPRNVHFSGDGSLKLARQVASVIAAKLGLNLPPEGVALAGPAARLVHHWRFNRDYRDEIARTENPSVNPAGFAFADGPLSPALRSLNQGSPRHLSLGTEAGGLKNLSVSFWFQVESLRQTAAVLIAKTNAGPPDLGWQIAVRHLKDTPAETAGVWFSVGNPGKKAVANIRCDRPVVSVGQGKWHHLAATFDSATGTGALYLDGVSVARATGIKQSPADLVSELKVNASGFIGLIDELQIWDGALTTSQVKELINQEGG